MKKGLFISLSAVFLLSGCVSTTKDVQPAKKVDAKTETKVTKTVTQEKQKVKKTVTSQTKKMKMPMQHKKMKMFQTVDAKDAILLQKGPNKEHCAICGMNLVKFYKTNHAATLGDHKVQYCSIHCLTDHIKEGAELENPMVVDVTTLKFIPVTEAFYVVGSDVRGTMSMVSKYAFKNLDDAKAFQKKHGGKIMDFYSAWQVAKKDFQK